ncbi:hypothetical protein L2E82_49165 [Cichorium intybus]|uniref:Uncharacterized protein n=1 Tax=Cichorium intybus TaxID=13427 RepID=A0ACB8YYX6_CICIN|nr:hypothetical protein L2E82_49165 [Cichorium intybus]
MRTTVAKLAPDTCFWKNKKLEPLRRASFGVGAVGVNQIGTVTEAIEVVKMAKDAEWGVVISQRSGETDDCFIADLAVDLATGQIKKLRISIHQS